MALQHRRFLLLKSVLFFFFNLPQMTSRKEDAGFVSSPPALRKRCFYQRTPQKRFLPFCQKPPGKSPGLRRKLAAHRGAAAALLGASGRDGTGAGQERAARLHFPQRGFTSSPLHPQKQLPGRPRSPFSRSPEPRRRERKKKHVKTR